MSKDGRYSTVQLGDIMSSTVEGAVLRTDGVGSINSFGSGYAMRIWLDPMKLAEFAMTPADVVNAVKAPPEKRDPNICQCCNWPIRTNVKDIHTECWIEHHSDPDVNEPHSDTCTFGEA